MSNYRMHRLCLMIMMLLLLTARQVVEAHGGGQPRLVNEPLEDYTISVWINPSPVTVGQVHLTIGLGFDGSVVLNRDIRVIVTPIVGGQVIEGHATHENATNRFFYESDTEITQMGMHQFEVQVEGIETTISFVEEVQSEPRTLNQRTVIVVIGAVLFIVQQVTRRLKRTRGKAEQKGS